MRPGAATLSVDTMGSQERYSITVKSLGVMLVSKLVSWLVSLYGGFAILPTLELR